MPVSIDGMHRLQVDRIPAMLRIHLGIQPADEARGWSALATLPFVPAGLYAVWPEIREPGGGLMVSVSDTNLAVAQTGLFGAVHQMLVRLPVDVRSLVIRGDEEAATGLGGVVVQPMEILCRPCRADPGIARRAVAYPQSTVFFLDDAAPAGPASFWIACGHGTRIVVQPSGAARAVTVRTRNGTGRERPHVPIARGQPSRRPRAVGRADDHRPRGPACGCGGRAAHGVRELRAPRVGAGRRSLAPAST